MTWCHSALDHQTGRAVPSKRVSSAEVPDPEKERWFHQEVMLDGEAQGRTPGRSFLLLYMEEPSQMAAKRAGLFLGRGSGWDLSWG